VLHGTITLLTNVAGSVATPTSPTTALLRSPSLRPRTRSTPIAANGLTYLNIADYNGADTLTVATNDLGSSSPATAPASRSGHCRDHRRRRRRHRQRQRYFAEDSGARISTCWPTTRSKIGPVDHIGHPGASRYSHHQRQRHGGNTTDDFVVYTQVADYNGTDSFTYTVTSGGDRDATVNVTILPSSTSPTTFSISARTPARTERWPMTARECGALHQRRDPGAHGTVTINNNTPGDATDDFLVYTQVAITAPSPSTR
jgi:hypothetical protein